MLWLQQQGDRLLLPSPSYRAGIGKSTLDFAGGRLPEGKSPLESVPTILQRELGIEASAIAQLIPLNTEGWAVNSSFSNQKLYGFVAYLEPKAELSHDLAMMVTYPTTSEGVQNLLQEITCLQCRAVLLEWILLNRS